MYSIYDYKENGNLVKILGWGIKIQVIYQCIEPILCAIVV